MDLWEALKQAQDGPVHVIRRSIGTMKVRYIKWTPNGLYETEQVSPLIPLGPALPYSPAGDDMAADDWKVCEADKVVVGTVDGLAAQAPELTGKFGCSIEAARGAVCQSILDGIQSGMFDTNEFKGYLHDAADSIRIMVEAEKILSDIPSDYEE